MLAGVFELKKTNKYTLSPDKSGTMSDSDLEYTELTVVVLTMGTIFPSITSTCITPYTINDGIGDHVKYKKFSAAFITKLLKLASHVILLDQIGCLSESCTRLITALPSSSCSSVKISPKLDACTTCTKVLLAS